VFEEKRLKWLELEGVWRRISKRSVNSFAWLHKDMKGLNPDIMCRQLVIDLKAKLIIQPRRKFGEEKW